MRCVRDFRAARVCAVRFAGSQPSLGDEWQQRAVEEFGIGLRGKLDQQLGHDCHSDLHRRHGGEDR